MVSLVIDRPHVFLPFYPIRPGIYVVQVMPTLLGDWSVMREWGWRG